MNPPTENNRCPLYQMIFFSIYKLGSTSNGVTENQIEDEWIIQDVTYWKYNCKHSKDWHALFQHISLARNRPQALIVLLEILNKLALAQVFLNIFFLQPNPFNFLLFWQSLLVWALLSIMTEIIKLEPRKLLHEILPSTLTVVLWFGKLAE